MLNDMPPSGGYLTNGHSPDFEKDLLGCMKKLKSYALSLTRDTDRANDLLQETLLKALSKKHLYMPDTNLAGWLFVIMRNHFYSLTRVAGRELGGGEEFWGAIDKFHSYEISPEERMDLVQVMAEMPPEKLDIVIQRDLMGLNYQEMQALGALNAAGTVKSRLSRSREAFRELLGDAYHREKQPKRRRAKRPLKTKPVIPQEVIMQLEGMAGAGQVSVSPNSAAAESSLEARATLVRTIEAQREEYTAMMRGIMQVKKIPKSRFIKALGVKLVASAQTGWNLLGGRSPWDNQRLEVWLEVVKMQAEDILKYADSYIERQRKFSGAGNAANTAVPDAPRTVSAPAMQPERAAAPVVKVVPVKPKPMKAEAASAPQTDLVDGMEALVLQLMAEKKAKLPRDQALVMFRKVLSALTR